MRIVATTPYYEPEGGGLERYAHEILSRLAANGHDVHAFAFTRADPRKEVRQGVRLERLAPLLRIGNTPIAPGFQRRLARKIEEIRPDVVLAHSPVPFPAEMAYLAARRRGVPFVLTYHGGRLRGSSLAREGLARLDRLTFERAMIRGSDRLVAVTPYVRDHALAARRDDVSIIPPGVATDRFCATSEPPEEEILFVGPLSSTYRWKGLDTLWRAYRLVLESRPHVRLVLVGEGDRREEFARKARKIGAPVELPGRLDEQALIARYQRAAAAVLPSTSDAESFGMVLAEANACARPVIGSDVGGIPDFVRHGENGLLAQPGDAVDLAARILEILDHPAASRRMGERGRARVERDHAWHDLANRTEGVLEAVADGP